jgi:hypothetical protein
MTVKERVRPAAVSVVERDFPVASKEASRLRFALDRLVHRLTGLHLIEPCNCARCQLRRFTVEQPDRNDSASANRPDPAGGASASARRVVALRPRACGATRRSASWHGVGAAP